MKEFYGIIAVIVGALILIVSHFLDWVDFNWIQVVAAVLVIGGIVAHIILNKKKPDYDA